MTIDRYLPKHMKNKLGISSLVILLVGQVGGGRI